MVFWLFKFFLQYFSHFGYIQSKKKKKIQMYFGHFIMGILVLLNILMVRCQFRRFYKFKFKNMSPTLFNFFIHVTIDGPICAATSCVVWASIQARRQQFLWAAAQDHEIKMIFGLLISTDCILHTSQHDIEDLLVVDIWVSKGQSEFSIKLQYFPK